MKENLEKIIDDPFFFRWVFDSDDAIEAYWRKYMDEHPEEVGSILEKRDDLLNLKHQNDRLSPEDKSKLSARIMLSLDAEDQKVRRLNFMKAFLRYAAVAVLFSCMTGLAVYFRMSNHVFENGYDRYVMEPIQVNEPTLILSENDKVSLLKSESTVDYSRMGEIVLNQDRVIRPVDREAQKTRINQLVIPFGSRSKIVLSDGTLVWLNAGSRLVYPSAFTENVREVTLYGEAFFDVSHDKNKPFIVKTSALDIKVLGTEFNISAYPDEQIIQTVLKEGSIALRKRNANLFERDLVLKPNQLNVFHKETGHSTVYKVNADDYTIWINGLLRFEDEDLSRVIKKVERHYNSGVSYEDTALGRIKITGKLDLHQDIDEVLEYLSKVSGTDYVKIRGNKYIIK
jgi:transmembrane sensor